VHRYLHQVFQAYSGPIDETTEICQYVGDDGGDVDTEEGPCRHGHSPACSVVEARSRARRRVRARVWRDVALRAALHGRVG
jgi:hypothetical protein